MGLKDAFDGLKEGLVDLSSLEVRTYSGDLTLFLDPDMSPDDFKELVAKSTTAPANGDPPQIKLMLYTRLDADGDSDHFFASGDIEKTMLESHVAAFQMGHEIRRAYLELFKQLALERIT
jgi:hypothetical protein